MASRSSHNKNNSAVKRILQEAKELGSDSCTDYAAGPLEDDIFEWHCTIRGPAGTEFEGGLYHCRVLLPSEYPFKPPNVMLLTPNGRFELNKKICISFTAYHEDLWQPAWGIRTAIVGLQGFFPIKGEAAVGIGSLDYPASERKRLAALSREWVCPDCGVPNKELLPDVPDASKADEEIGSTAPSEHAGHPHLHPHPAAPADATLSSVSVIISPAVPEASHVSAPPSLPASGPVLPLPVPAHATTQLTTGTTPDQPRPSAPHSQSTSSIHLRPLPSRPPLVLDGLIVALVAIMAYILAKKVGVQQAIMAML